MKPWYQSKKLWTAVVTAVVAIVGDYCDKPELAVILSAIGAVLIAGFAAADHGKEAAALESGDDE